MTLTSYGKDGKPGGEGEDSDISESHWLRREDGSLWVGDEMWVVESEIKEENNSNQKLQSAVKTSVDSVNAQSTQPHP